MIEVLDKDEIDFELNGGAKAVVKTALSFVATWIAIGALIRIGWRIVG